MIVGFQALGTDLASAAFLARIPANLVDKGIACVIAWIILRKLPAHMQSLSGGKKKKEKTEEAAAPQANNRPARGRAGHIGRKIGMIQDATSPHF